MLMLYLDGKNTSKLLNSVILLIYDNNTFFYKINREYFFYYVWCIVTGELLVIIHIHVNVLFTTI